MKKAFSILILSLICALTLFTSCSPTGEGEPSLSKATSIAVTGQKNVFLLGEELSIGDGKVTVSFEDGTSRVLTNQEYTLQANAFNTVVPGRGTITVQVKNSSLSLNYDAQAVRGKESFKVLAIGNSFSEDSLAHIYQMADEMGVEEIVLANMYIGGCTLAKHATNMKADKSAYQYQKNTNGTWVKNDGKSLSFALKDEEWDVITLQQASGDSGMIDTYNQDLSDLLQFIYLNRPSAKTNVFWNMTWAYQADSNHADFTKYNHSQNEMYQAIVNCVQQKIVTNKLIQGVIPAGTAIQNLREKVGDNVTRDGYHLSYTVGRYTAGMTWLKTLTGWSIDELTCDYFSLEEGVLSSIKQSVNEAYDTPYLQLTTN